jgi:hypothetical protein
MFKLNIKTIAVILGIVLGTTSAFTSSNLDEYGFDDQHGQGWVNINDPMPEGFVSYSCDSSEDICTYLQPNTSQPTSRTGKFSLVPEDPGK